MLKVTKSIIFISFFAVLVFVPVIKAGATYTYIGIQIDAVKRLATMEDTCLKPGTIMSIMDGTTVKDTVTTTATVGPTASPNNCSTNQIWSPLVNLENGTYSIKIETPICWGYWHKDSEIAQNQYSSTYKCLYGGTLHGSLVTHDLGRNESCKEICGERNLTVATNGSAVWDENAGALKNQTGTLCNDYNIVDDCYYGASVYVIGNGQCYCEQCRDCANPSNCIQNAGWKDVNWARVCVCNHPIGTYNFPFTFTAS